MTDKERLKEISDLLERYYSTEDSFEQTDLAIEIIQGHVDWLLNRIEELELEVNDWREEVRKWQQFYKESEESHLETKELLYSVINENQRYKQILKFYADEENYEPSEVQIGEVTKEGYKISRYKYDPKINIDNGGKARQALKGE